MTDAPICGLCGNDDITAEDAEYIDANMDFDNKVCPACGMCFWEAREEAMGEDE